jgi:hypothetical protein
MLEQGGKFPPLVVVQQSQHSILDVSDEFVRRSQLQSPVRRQQRLDAGLSVLSRAMTKYWIGVASRDHVEKGVEGGFCHLCHGKMTAVRRLTAGDWIAYDSSRTHMQGGDPLRVFTAIGQLKDGEPYVIRLAGAMGADLRTNPVG